MQNTQFRTFIERAISFFVKSRPASVRNNQMQVIYFIKSNIQFNHAKLFQLIQFASSLCVILCVLTTGWQPFIESITPEISQRFKKKNVLSLIFFKIRTNSVFMNKSFFKPNRQFLELFVRNRRPFTIFKQADLLANKVKFILFFSRCLLIF